MTLLVDNRAALAGQPGLHALIVGVSTYPFLDGGTHPVPDTWTMGQLTAPARSALQVYAWLRDADTDGRLPVRLVTCRVLSSPSPGEAGEVGAAGVTDAATLENFAPAAKAWRNDAKARRDNVTFFYFAGHGLQRSIEDSVLCLENFRDPGFQDLTKAVALANIRGGMAPSDEFPDIPRTQFYFVDACRERPGQLSKYEKMHPTDVFNVALSGSDDRSSPIYYASVSNTVANALPGGQTLFSRAMIECLNGEAAEALDEDAQGVVRWGVTVEGLSAQLAGYKTDALNREFAADQKFAPGGQFRRAVICYLQQPPPVVLSVEVIPPEACQFGRVRLARAGEPPAVDMAPPLAPHPVRLPAVPGGIYRLEMSFDPPRPPFVVGTKDFILKPVVVSGKIKVG